jgi:16S rRNA (cytosine967-C5)-methyltransferase
MKGTGTIVATEIRAPMRQNFHKRLQRCGIRIIGIHAWDGTAITAPSRLFDGVLVDAPCSGLGTWGRNPDARWRISEDTVARLAETQIALLTTAADKVRPRGRLVYSVCTLTEKETHQVVEFFIKSRGDFRLSPAVHPLTGVPAPGPIWIWPWDGPCNGMFIAVMQRTDYC